jgi:hypothetical protein
MGFQLATRVLGESTLRITGITVSEAAYVSRQRNDDDNRTQKPHLSGRLKGNVDRTRQCAISVIAMHVQGFWSDDRPPLVRPARGWIVSRPGADSWPVTTLGL